MFSVALCLKRFPRSVGGVFVGVGLDDVLDEAVADDVGFVEFDEADAFDAVEGAVGVDETGVFSLFEIDLGRVAGDDHFAAFAEAGEEHEHLRGGGVLGFIEDDDGFIEGAATHVSEGCDFDDVAGHVAADLLEGHHVGECVEEWAEVGVYFFFDAAGEEAEFFAGFDGGADEDDAADDGAAQEADGHGDGEEGFAGAGGAFAEDEVVVDDGLEVAFLSVSFGVDEVAAGHDVEGAGIVRACAGAGGVAEDFGFGAADDGDELVAVDGGVVAEVALELGDDGSGAADGGGLAGDFEIVVACGEVDVEEFAQQLQIPIPVPQKCRRINRRINRQV